MAKQLRKSADEKETIIAALEQFLVEKKPLQTVSKEFDIPRNSLSRYAKRFSRIGDFITKSHDEKLEIIDDITTHHGTQVGLKQLRRYVVFVTHRCDIVFSIGFQ